MTLDEAIADAQSFQSDPPTNESNTCDWIILPLLHASGYSKREIESRIADNGGQFPDYTLLPGDHSRCWYLEAKAWNVALEDIHARQALNYANHNGRRFVVLTNGQQWRLYDNGIQGKLPEKLIAEAPLQETARIAEFLTVLSKTQVLADSFERVAAELPARRQAEAVEQEARRKQAEAVLRFRQRQTELRNRLEAELPDALSDVDNEIVQFITLYLNDKGQYEDLAPATLSDWFVEMLTEPPIGRGVGRSAVTALQQDHPPLVQSDGQRTLSLKMIQGIPIDGNNSKPILLETPDGKKHPVRSWVGLAEEAVRWLLQQSQPLPLPFESSHSTRWFLNKEAVHKRETLRRKFKSISASGKMVHMDADRSGEMFLRDIYNLCKAMGIAPEGFAVTVVD